MADWRDRMKVIESKLDDIQSQIDFLKARCMVSFTDPPEPRTEFTPEPEKENDDEK